MEVQQFLISESVSQWFSVVVLGQSWWFRKISGSGSGWLFAANCSWQCKGGHGGIARALSAEDAPSRQTTRVQSTQWPPSCPSLVNGSCSIFSQSLPPWEALKRRGTDVAKCYQLPACVVMDVDLPTTKQTPPWCNIPPDSGSLECTNVLSSLEKLLCFTGNLSSCHVVHGFSWWQMIVMIVHCHWLAPCVKIFWLKTSDFHLTLCRPGLS